MTLPTLPASFFAADTGYLLLTFGLLPTLLGLISITLRSSSSNLDSWERQQRLISLHAYAAELQARTRNGGVL